MMAELLKRADALARARQRLKTRQIADELRWLIKGVSIEVEEARVLVSGRRLVKRWLIDPSLRFLSGGFK